VKGNKKGFYKYINSKRKSGENMSLLLNRTGDLVAKVTEKADVLNATFTSVFTGKINFQDSQTPETRGSLRQGRLTLGGRESG